METYINSLYFSYFIYSLLGYFGAWLLAFVFSRLLFNGKSGSNPLPGVLSSWSFAFVLHAVTSLIISISILNQMSKEGYETSRIILYNLGFAVVILIDFAIIFRFQAKRKTIAQ